MPSKAVNKKKGNCFEKAGEDEERTAKTGNKGRLPIKIDAGGGDLRSNVTSFLVDTIICFDNNMEGVLTSLSLLDKRVLNPRGIKDPSKLVKVSFKMLQLIWSTTASQTIQEVANVACQFVYD